MVVNLITTFLIVMVSDAEERFGRSDQKGENQRKRSMCGLLYEIAWVSCGFCGGAKSTICYFK